MSKSRVNWGFAAWMAVLASLLGGGGTGIVFLLQSGMAETEALKPTTEAADGARYALINSDIIEVQKDDLKHIFNFAFDHVIVMGKVGETEIKHGFTFGQFGDKGIIPEVTTRGCAIAARSAAGIVDNGIEKVITARENARLFLQKHCPKPQGPNG